MQRIKGLNIAHLPNATHLKFLKDVVARADEHEAVAAAAAAQLEELRSAVQEEDKYLGATRKSRYTDGIAAADVARDQLYKAYCRCINAYARMPDSTIAQAAGMLRQHRVSFKVDTAKELAHESGQMDIFISSLREQHAERLALLSLTPIVDAMEAQNNMLDELWRKRTEEVAPRKKGAMRTARRKAGDAYRRFVQMVNALAVIDQGNTYDDFISLINEIIKRIKITL